VTTFLFYAAVLLVGLLVVVAIAVVYMIMSDELNDEQKLDD